MKLVATLLALVLTGCSGCPSPSPSDAGPPDVVQDVAQEAASAGATTKVIISNTTDAGATVNISVGADSVVQPSAWDFCHVDAGLTCSMPLGAGVSKVLPTEGQYLNASIAFNGPVGCKAPSGSTIAEFTANNPNGYGTADVSLVNGWNADVEILVDGQKLGPAKGQHNENVSGVFPFGCDICVARQNPPCGIPACGSSPNDGGQNCGCKSGGQYNPTVPCQITYQKADAGSLLNVVLLP
jgi:hypothetical protein